MKIRPKIDLSVRLGELKLATPVVCASGTFGLGYQLKGLVDFKNIGAITTKTITLNPREGNPPPRIFETDYGVINSVGLENPGLDIFIKEELPKIKKLKTKCIVSIGGFSFDEYEEIARRLNRINDIEALEANLSCPNIKLKKMISQNEKSTYQLTKALRRVTPKPLFIKVTPEISDIVKIAKAVKDAGADGLSLVNTFFSLAINIETQKPYLGSIFGGYSGRAIKPLSLYRVWRLRKEVDIPLIAGGGIESAADALEFILAGAQAVSLGTINLVYPNQAKEVVSGIKEYLRKKGIDDINQLRGKLNEPTLE